MTIKYLGSDQARGTAAERTGGTWTGTPTGYRFFETDTGLEYYWNGTAWSQTTGAKTANSYLIEKVGSNYFVRNFTGGTVGSSNTDPGALLNTLQSSLVDGDTIEFKNDTYTGTTDYTNNGKTRLQFIGNGATLSGWKIKFDGSTSLTSSRCIIHGFKFSGANAGIVIDNTSLITVENCEFLNCSAGVSFESSAKWAEIGRLSNCFFRRCTKGVVFKTPTGTGTGSYINSMMDHCFFSSSTPADGVITTDYTFIEIQSGVQVSEGKWTNSRFWFDAGSVIGIGIDNSGVGTRCMIHKHYFENFSPATGTIGIRYNSGANSLYFLGRPIFAGNGTWDTKFKNTTNVQLHGSVETFRQGHTITPSATADTYGTIVNCVNIADTEGLPNIYVIIGGTVGGSETITVNIDVTGYQGTVNTLTKTYTATGTFPLRFTDYTAMVTAGNYTIIDYFAVKAKSSGASTAATVNFVAFNGGTCSDVSVSKSLVIYSYNSTSSTASNFFMFPFTPTATTTESLCDFVSDYTLTLKRLRVIVPTNAKTGSFTTAVRDNAVDVTGTRLTITAGSTGEFDSGALSVDILAGHKISFNVDCSAAGATAMSMFAIVECEANLI